MAPLVLEGATLGKRHQHYNKLLKEAIASGKAEPAKIDYNKTDIENVFNIDIASNNRDVEYILDVLKGEDLYYVSRAIKRSNWLFTDTQYAHIIDPEYLHSQLFPQMMPKAACKLLLHIRLALKDESRVDRFFQYFKEKDFKTAAKWLPNCPISVIESAVEKHTSEISTDIFERLCKRSPKVFEIFLKASEDQHHQHPYVNAAMFLLRSNPELYLDGIEKYNRYEMLTCNKKYTEVLMKKCPGRIINNFEKYVFCVDVETFAKYLKKEDIKSFILKELDNKDKNSLDQYTISYFIKHVSKEEKYGFIKKFIDKTTANLGDANKMKIYRWYSCAPFDMAFTELKKIIRAESNENVRNTLLGIMVTSAGKDLNHIHTVLQYYRENHMKEPFRFKAQFVYSLLRETDSHLFDGKTWAILDELFRSMKVYVESENNHQIETFVRAIMAYKITHGKPVPTVIEIKFKVDFLRPYYWKLKGVEKEKLFTYLFNLFLMRLNKCVISNQKQFEEYVELLKQGLNFLKYWNKKLDDYPILTSKIKDCVRMKKEKGWNSSSLMALYDMLKSWRKNIFEDSLIFCPCQKVCLNALKHDPELLLRYKNEVGALCCNDSMRMDKVLHKLRVYWPQTIGKECTAAYLGRLNKPGGHKALVRGLCCLLNQNQLLKFVQKYEPQETKINQTNAEELQVSLRKNIAKSMHIARPQVEPDVVLKYAKGDYVRFAQPALNSVMSNLRSSDSQDYINNFLNNNGMASLQKLGIHLATAKLSTVDMIKILEDVWKTTNISSVRATVFHTTHKLLCKEKDEALITELWALMQTFIDSLTAKEDKAIYETFGKLYRVHPSVKTLYYMKSYRFLKSLPPKGVWKKVLQQVKEQMSMFSEQLDPDLVESMIEEFVNEIKFTVTQDFEWNHRHDMKILTTYLLSADDDSIQTERFVKVFVPLMDKLLPFWNDSRRNGFVKKNFAEIIQSLFKLTNDAILKNKARPSTLYRNILKKLQRSLPPKQNIVLFRQLKLAAAFVDILYKKKSESNQTWTDSLRHWQQINDLYLTCVPDIGKVIIQYVEEDMNAYGSLFYKPVAEALKFVFTNIGINESAMLKCLKYMLGKKEFIPICLLVVDVLPEFWVSIQKETVGGFTVMGNDRTREAKEIRDMLLSHPSPVVKIHYIMRLSDDHDDDDDE